MSLEIVLGEEQRQRACARYVPVIGLPAISRYLLFAVGSHIRQGTSLSVAVWVSVETSMNVDRRGSEASDSFSYSFILYNANLEEGNFH